MRPQTNYRYNTLQYTIVLLYSQLYDLCIFIPFCSSLLMLFAGNDWELKTEKVYMLTVRGMCNTFCLIGCVCVWCFLTFSFLHCFHFFSGTVSWC